VKGGRWVKGSPFPSELSFTLEGKVGGVEVVVFTLSNSKVMRCGK